LVQSIDSTGKRIAQTPQHHFCTNNVSGKWTNPKTIKASANSVTLNKGATYKLNAKVTKVKKKKKLTNGRHTQKIRYMSGNNQVATVSSNGTIKAVGTGWCRVYVMAANGIWQTITVTVR